MENTEQPSKTRILQIILAIVPLILLILVWTKKEVYFENDKVIFRIISFTLLTVSGFLSYQNSQEEKRKRMSILLMVILGINAFIALYDFLKI